MRPLLLLALVTLSLAFAPAPIPKGKRPAKAESVLRRLEGNWVVESHAVGGAVQGGPGQRWEAVRIERGTWSQGCTPPETGKRTWTTPYLIAIHADASRIDMAYRPDDEPLLYGLLRLDGDRLVVTHATSGPVPDSHDAPLRGGQVRWVLRRAGR